MDSRGRAVHERPFHRAARSVRTDGVVALTRDGTIASWNEGAERIVGRPPADALGEPLSKFVGGREPVAALLEDARTTGRSEGECRCRCSDGSADRVRVAVSAVDEEGRFRGFLAVLTDVTGPRGRERGHRRAGRATCDPVHRLVEELVRRVVGAEGREDVETTVREHLADAPLYTAAWIDEWGAEDGTLLDHAGAGDGERHAIVAGTGPDDGAGAGSVVLRGPDDAEGLPEPVDRLPESVERAARDRDGEAVGVFPIGHGGTTYGVLVVHAERDDAFREHERTALETLARTAGFAIHARTQQRLLLADAVVEVEFEATGSDAVFATLADRCGCRCRVADVVRDDEAALLQFLAVEGAPPRRVREALADVEGVASHRIAGGDEPYRLEVRVSPGGFLDRALDAGALVRTAVGSPDRSRVVLQTVPGNIDAVDDLVEGPFPEWTLTRKETVDRSARSVEQPGGAVEELLTDKQLAALRTAYMRGYFDYPRESTAEEVAADLGIADATLFQHLQAAQRKLVEACLYRGRDRPW